MERFQPDPTIAYILTAGGIPPVPISGAALLQPYIVILTALGTYQLWLAMSLRKAVRAS